MNPYRNDPVVFEIAARLPELRPSAGDTVVVGIDGCGGAGKSTLAEFLAAQVPRAAIVHTDDFASQDNPLDWWPRLVEQVLGPLARGETARYQRFDWDQRELAEWIEIDGNFVILEGVSATRSELSDYLALTVFVDCPREVRLRRGLERDGPSAEALWREWMLAEDEYLTRDKPEVRADYIVHGL